MTAQTLKTMTHSLDAWLWRRGIGHPVIRPLVRNELLLTALFLLGGGAAFSATPWFFWFGVGLGIMTLTFWSLARFFLRMGLGLKGACEGVARIPDVSGKITGTMILAFAFIESLAIYALVISFILLYANPYA